VKKSYTIAKRAPVLLSTLGVAFILGLAPSSGHAADPEDADVDEREAVDERGTDPENTGINVRDREGDSVTAFDQGNSEADRNITASIRKAVVDDDSLSTNAHNVKIITVGGVVTLRGPVESAKEKRSIETKAKAVSGVTSVNSQLEVDSD
jgi:osmotically-inducible protein OsmY